MNEKIKPAAAQEAGSCERCGRCRDGDFANCKNARSLAEASKAALPFVAYAYSKGIEGAESAGRAIESALVASVDAATAWADGYASGVIDERTSDSNIGISGFGAKIDPARANPYLLATPVAAAPVVRRAIADEAPFGLSTAEKVAWARGVNDCLDEYRDAAIPEIDSGLYSWLQERGICPDSHEGMIEMGEVVEALNEHERQLLESTPAAPGMDHLRSVINALSRNISDAYETACQNGDERMQTVQNARQSLLNTIREALPPTDAGPKGGNPDAQMAATVMEYMTRTGNLSLTWGDVAALSQQPTSAEVGA